MKNNIVKIASFIIIIICSVYFLFNLNRQEYTNTQKDDKLCTTQVCSINDSNDILISIYPTGQNEETYYFIINNNQLNAYKGTRKNDDICSQNFLYKFDISDNKILDKATTLKIIGLLDEIELNSEIINSDYQYDSWYISVVYKGVIYGSDCFTAHSAISALINLITEESPIPVDLHSFS